MIVASTSIFMMRRRSKEASALASRISFDLFDNDRIRKAFSNFQHEFVPWCLDFDVHNESCISSFGVFNPLHSPPSWSFAVTIFSGLGKQKIGYDIRRDYTRFLKGIIYTVEQDENETVYIVVSWENDES